MVRKVHMDRINLFPDTTKIENSVLTVGGLNLSDLADQFGTPLYLYDRATMDNIVKTYQANLAAFYPGDSNLTYAGKAYLCIAIAEWTQQHNLWIDCTGVGEITIAVEAGVPRERILVHGVNKSAADLVAASKCAGVIVVDNLTELHHVIDISLHMRVPDLWLRFQPGLSVETHAYTQTGQAGSKFGMDAAKILEAAQLCREHALSLTGLHFHQGSQFKNPTPLAVGIEHALDLAKAIGLNEDWTLCPGGGWGVVYHEAELPQPNLEEYISFVAGNILQGCKKRDLSLPKLQLEPGRSLVARAGVALYRVGAIKRTTNRVWVLLDGGLADNPRPALYGAKYSALPVRDPLRQVKEPVWFGGPYCESGDVLIKALPFPEIREGELVAIPVSGAYQLSMSSNYNGGRRPAVIWVDQGRVQVIQEREAIEDLLRRDHRLVKLTGKG